MRTIVLRKCLLKFSNKSLIFLKFNNVVLKSEKNIEAENESKNLRNDNISLAKIVQ